MEANILEQHLQVVMLRNERN